MSRLLIDHLGLAHDVWIETAIVEREVEIERHLDSLIARDQGRERNDASISCWQAWAFPEITEKRSLGVFLKALGQPSA